MREIHVETFEEVQECLGELQMQLEDLEERTKSSEFAVHSISIETKETLVAVKSVIRRVDRQIGMLRRRMKTLEHEQDKQKGRVFSLSKTVKIVHDYLFRGDKNE